MLPYDLPLWGTVHYYFRRFRLDGTWKNIRQPVGQDNKKGGTERGYDADKHVSGHKRHILVDTMGLLLMVVVHAASVSAQAGARQIMEKVATAKSFCQRPLKASPTIVLITSQSTSR